MNVTIALALEMHLAVTMMAHILVIVISVTQGMAMSAQITVNIATATLIKSVLPYQTTFNVFAMVTIWSSSMEAVPCPEAMLTSWDLQ